MSIKRPSSTFLLGCAATFILAACGSSSSSTNGGSSSAHASASKSAPSVPFSSLEQQVPQGYPKPKPGHFRFAYMNPETGNEFLNTLGDAMRLETQKLGGSYVQVDANGSVSTQASQFAQLIAQKVNGIAVFALDPASLAPYVKRARAAGIHLVTIDLNFTRTTGLGGYESQVLQRRDQASYQTTQYMVKALGSGASVGTIDYQIKVPSIVFEIQRDLYWAQKFGLKVVGNASNPSDDIAGGTTAMTTLLGKYSGIKGVMAYNDPSATGASSAARSQGINNLLLGGENGGSDALAAIKAGRETFSVKIDAPSTGKAWAWGLYDLSEGIKVPPTVKAGPPLVVDKANVGSTLTWGQQLKQEYPNG